MSEADRQRWEARHLAAGAVGAPRDVLKLAPSAPFPGAVCLDLASGGGRHWAPLTALGYHVVGLDIALSALHRGAPHTGQHPCLDRVQADLDDWPLAPSSCELVVQVDFLSRSLVEHAFATVKPGGYILVDTFLYTGHPNREGPKNPEYQLRPGELQSWAGDWHILLCSEVDGPTARGTLIAQCPDIRPAQL
ncbi:MAG: SAM-dependent methyltransferase [Hyphomicrobiaceae bacterium]|jgi:SAM-dependent methyltransferase